MDQSETVIKVAEKQRLFCVNKVKVAEKQRIFCVNKVSILYFPDKKKLDGIRQLQISML